MNKLPRRIAAAVLGAGIAFTAALGPTAAQASVSHRDVAGRVSSVSPLSYSLASSVTGQRQTTSYYCVPASSKLVLSGFGISVSQATLAKKMGTTASAGTSGANADKVLNSYVNPKGYQVTVRSAKNPATLMSLVRYDIGTLHRPAYIGVWMEDLPWNKGKISGNNIGHGIAVYGYNATKGTITVYDPWKATGGTHTITSAQLAADSQANGGLHYISLK